MAQLIVRNIEDELVQELKIRAAQNGQSAEEEHRQILRRALGTSHSGLSLKEMLEQMPDVGDDDLFERVQDQGRTVEL
jgi:plasmid stability protein